MGDIKIGADVCVYLVAPHSLCTTEFSGFLFQPAYIFIVLLSTCKIIRNLFSALPKSFPIQIFTWFCCCCCCNTTLHVCV